MSHTLSLFRETDTATSDAPTAPGGRYLPEMKVMNEHAIFPDTVLAHDHHGRSYRIGLNANIGRTVLWWPEQPTLWPDIRSVDRLAHLLLLTASAAAHRMW